ncbi:alpha/beta fold hydrolase [Dyadobacter chenhuakuii]|uniref:Alpha/beta hydrolase n=1 Tax=Dyadobacter chenhuakuii TaxID=2909339 RepID=A0ABY4XGW8_9BACT|nr:alpha/beta hydrolase [Dyadobacter chenhuakuii]MCF2495648.1 alpha/beta hydrolase [Dyadobacter chenhuakuii]USJ29682.1 alpha/beta hydrolase [Dyadobacter chenhuakuii]
MQEPTTLPFHKLGCGNRILLAFHGIGQDGASCFRPFEKMLGERYTIYAFDLYFHGLSLGVQSGVVTKQFWVEQVRHFLETEKIGRFDIAGFSMGGRFALATLEGFPERVDDVFLIAPDGVSEHPLYSLASRFAPARGLFRWSMKRPEAFFKVADVLQKAGLVNASLYRFTQQVLNTPDKRQTVYNSWVHFRDLRFDISALYQKASINNVSIYLFVGQFDKLLKPAAVRRLADLIPKNQYIQLKSGHTQLVEQAASWIFALFK